MINSLSEARATLAVLMEEVTELSSLESVTPEQEARLDSLVATEIDEQRARVDALEAREAKVSEIRKLSERESVREEGADPASRGSRKKSDPFDLSEVRGDMSAPGRVRELRARAHDAIEQAPEYVTDAQRTSAAKHLDNDTKGDVAAHYLTYGSPEYVDSWTNYMTTGTFRSSDGEHNRAAMSTTAANGGYLIPFHLDPTVILTNAGSTNPFRAISRVDTIASNVWHGVTSAGVTAEWTEGFFQTPGEPLPRERYLDGSSWEIVVPWTADRVGFGQSSPPFVAFSNFGFRVATVPTPGPLMVALLSPLLAARRWRR